jgi:hypothetical protein
MAAQRRAPEAVLAIEGITHSSTFTCMRFRFRMCTERFARAP